MKKNIRTFVGPVRFQLNSYLFSFYFIFVYLYSNDYCLSALFNETCVKEGLLSECTSKLLEPLTNKKMNTILGEKKI